MATSGPGGQISGIPVIWGSIPAAGDLIEFNGTNWTNSSSAGKGVDTVTNSDGSLTISPNSGAVVASLATGVMQNFGGGTGGGINFIPISGGYPTVATDNWAIVDNASNNLTIVPGTDGLIGAVNAAQTLQSFTFSTATGKLTFYAGIQTAGNGVPGIVASNAVGSVSTTQTNLINYSPPAAAGRYRMTIIVSTTSGTNTGTITPSVGYASPGGQSTFTPNFEQSNSATFVVAPTGASKDWSSVFNFMITNAQTAITLTLTVAGTVAYYASAVLEQLA